MREPLAWLRRHASTLTMCGYAVVMILAACGLSWPLCALFLAHMIYLAR